MSGFERFQLVHPCVVFLVADGGVVENVVLIFVMAEEFVELGYAGGWIGLGGTAHGQEVERVQGQRALGIRY